MEELKYVIEDSTIAEILGVQNFSTKESAVLELVKNAFDAGATALDLEFRDGQLIILDNGRGMDDCDIRENWMHVGSSPKDYEFKDMNNNTRIYAGSKGIGRFALSRLGEEVSVYSKTKKHAGIHWHTNWERNTLEEFNDLQAASGTKIVISKLRDRWTTKSIEQLQNYLSRTYNSDYMTIRILHDEKIEVVAKYFGDAKVGINCLSYIDLDYDANNLLLCYKIFSDEFSVNAKEYCDEKILSYKEDKINIAKELNRKDLDIDEDDYIVLLKDLGSFNARLFFSLKEASTVDAEKFLYKYKVLSERFQEGIILYRNSFSISSYDGKKDWLELGKRSRKSPAAASHPTGSWRVRENQMAGYVEIDKKENNYLRDLSNRQGIEENAYYNLFVKIIQIGISKFEEYRQNIIRKIDIKNSKKPSAATPQIDKIVKSPQAIYTFDKKDVENLVNEIKQVQKERKFEEQQAKSTEEKYKYDIRMLNMLSTIGLRASSIAHEMQNDRNNIDAFYSNMVNALKEFGVWDIIDSPENKKYAYKNVPELLENNKHINTKIMRFIDTMLSNVEKEQFTISELNVTPIMLEIKAIWERDYSWIKINVPNIPIYFITAEDIIKVIIDNLILNSVQQNDSRNSLTINIDIKQFSNQLLIIYSDDGVGLPQKYVANPRKILDVHESSRPKGHGLGMWIINNTLVMSGGEVLDIPIKQGFEIQMILGDKI